MIPWYLSMIIGLGFFVFGWLAAKTDSNIEEIKGYKRHKIKELR